MKKHTVVNVLSGLRTLINEHSNQMDTARKDSWSASETASLYVEVKALTDLVAGMQTDLHKLRDKMAYEDVPAAFERDQVKSLTLERGVRVHIQAFVRASSKDMPAAIRWMKLCTCGHDSEDHFEGAQYCGARIDTGRRVGKAAVADVCPCKKYEAPNAPLVKETINASTLAAFAKSQMEEGRELPEEIFNVFVGQNTSVTKI